jgi:hypothetical protein
VKTWLIILAWYVGGAIQGYAIGRHLVTDPHCKFYRPPRPGSRVDRWSRGLMCEPCLARAAFGDEVCISFPVKPEGDES